MDEMDLHIHKCFYEECLEKSSGQIGNKWDGEMKITCHSNALRHG